MSDARIPERLPEIPALDSLVPEMMTASALQENLVLLFEWLQTAEALPKSADIDQGLIDRVRDTVNLLLEERRDRHADEPGFRGG